MDSKLIKKLDAVFSEYIRLRDSDANGVARCVSCGNMFSWKLMDAGHFMGRANMGTRYHERNVWAQCRMCNRIKHGNIAAYERNLIRRIGKENVEALRIKAHGIKRYSDSELRELLVHYQEEVKRLKNGKMIC